VDLLSNPVIIALTTFFIGFGGGIYVYKLKGSSSGQTEKLKSEKQALEEEFDEYKNSVADHFAQTSELLGGLTDNYVKVYQHLAEGSQSLTNADHPSLKLGLNEKQLAASLKQIESSEETKADSDDMQAPRDYAPKPADKDAEGTLSEAFSIKTDSHEVEEILEPMPGEQKLA